MSGEECFEIQKLLEENNDDLDYESKTEPTQHLHAPPTAVHTHVTNICTAFRVIIVVVLVTFAIAIILHQLVVPKIIRDRLSEPILSSFNNVSIVSLNETGVCFLISLSTTLKQLVPPLLVNVAMSRWEISSLTTLEGEPISPVVIAKTNIEPFQFQLSNSPSISFAASVTAINSSYLSDMVLMNSSDFKISLRIKGILSFSIMNGFIYWTSIFVDPIWKLNGIDQPMSPSFSDFNLTLIDLDKTIFHNGRIHPKASILVGYTNPSKLSLNDVANVSCIVYYHTDLVATALIHQIHLAPHLNNTARAEIDTNPRAWKGWLDIGSKYLRREPIGLSISNITASAFSDNGTPVKVRWLNQILKVINKTAIIPPRN